MADNFAFTQGSGTTGAADDIGGVLYPRLKVSLGADGSATDALGGAGAVAAGVIRATLASDDPAVASLAILDNIVSGNEAQVDIVAALPAGTNNIGDVDVASIAAGTNNIGDVDVASIAAGTNNIGDVDVASIAAGETHIGEVGGRSNVYSVTLSTDTSAYASGDLIADTQQLDGFFRKVDGTGVIQSITITDEEAQGVAMYLLFHKTSTSMGSENSAPNISDANLSAGLIGMVSIAAADWITVSGAKVASIQNIGLPVEAVSGTDDLYISALNSTGTPDWDADSLVVQIGTLLD